MMSEFQLHIDFTKKIEVCDLKLNKVLIEKTKDFFWLILVPRLPDLKTIVDFDDQNYDLFCSEVRFVAKVLKKEFNAEHLNIATIGNITPQLHCHIIVRNKNDALWPKPVWGEKITPVNDEDLLQIVGKLKELLVK